MIAKEIVSDVIRPIKISDTVQKVFERMAEFRVNNLPVVSGFEFLGLLREEDIIETPDHNISIKKLNLPLANISVNENQHVYDVIRLFCEQQLSVVPVLDQMRNYVGVISINTMMDHIAAITSGKETGGIIVLEINNRSNSLAHIAQIVESNNAQILSSYVQSFPDSTRLEVTLKLNRTDISAIIASFLRYDYIIKATFNDIKNDTTQDRYDQLMNYLNI
jgi:acetoin utilization protein AcuB